MKKKKTKDFFFLLFKKILISINWQLLFTQMALGCAPDEIKKKAGNQSAACIINFIRGIGIQIIS